jgi:DNA polymerase-3 subunit delta'
MAGGTAPELRYICPNEKGAIPIEEVRAAIEDLQVKPAYGAHRVCVVDDCDAMTAQAQNAFLKTLEEPPAQGILILTASRPDSLLGTVLSRVERFDIDRPSEDEAAALIRERYPRFAEQEHFIFKYADGSIGLMQKLCEDEDFMPLREECLAHFSAMLTDKVDAAFAFAGWLERNESRSDDITRVLLTFYSDLLMMQSGLMSRVINRDYQSKLAGLLNAADAETCHRGTTAIAAFGRRRKGAVNLRLCCEALGLDLTITQKESK